MPFMECFKCTFAIFTKIFQTAYPINVPHMFAIKSSISVARVVTNCDISINNEKPAPNKAVRYNLRQSFQISGSRNPRGTHIMIFRKKLKFIPVKGTKLIVPFIIDGLMLPSGPLRISLRVPIPVTSNTCQI